MFTSVYVCKLLLYVWVSSSQWSYSNVYLFPSVGSDMSARLMGAWCRGNMTSDSIHLRRIDVKNFDRIKLAWVPGIYYIATLGNRRNNKKSSHGAKSWEDLKFAISALPGNLSALRLLINLGHRLLMTLLWCRPQEMRTLGVRISETRVLVTGVFAISVGTKEVVSCVAHDPICPTKRTSGTL